MKILKSKSIPFVLAFGAIILLIVAITPLLMIAQYYHPCADDYTYGLTAHEACYT